MKAKQIKLLKKQITKLEEKGFDLEVWKISTILLLEKIFGRSSSEIKQIKDISGDMSSWTLRDNLGDEKSDRSKMLGKQILETCIDELELGDESETSTNNAILDQLKNELTGSQYNKINIILSQQVETEEKAKQLSDVLVGLDKTVLSQILTQLLVK